MSWTQRLLGRRRVLLTLAAILAAVGVIAVLAVAWQLIDSTLTIALILLASSTYLALQILILAKLIASDRESRRINELARREANTQRKILRATRLLTEAITQQTTELEDHRRRSIEHVDRTAALLNQRLASAPAAQAAPPTSTK